MEIANNTGAGRATRRPRHAIYFAPKTGHPLHTLGSRWLGRDAVLCEDLDQPALAGLTRQRLAAITAEARHYGFHATLKPPFFLKPGLTPCGLLAAAERFAASRAPFTLRLVLDRLSGFFALLPQRDDTWRAHALAAAAVVAFDSFRASPGPNELQRRRQIGLSTLQETMFRRWGYPFVMDAFRFHMTLSARITDPQEADSLETALNEHFSDCLKHELLVDAISVFRQESAAEHFRELARFPLRAPA